ncbi:putative secreted protein [Rhodopirellula maiorica SM1]|uniref:Putative secreted protein n=1 Tax=Rhodopirellula maiorica SM1 TaxID=1265738 RepID=M5RJH6_9BACT|nr:hypothetical protein [Rhodopirellula maiorica]EMI15532.1 putative secreted protein [Rhodopirellula maiorica SM1]
MRTFIRNASLFCAIQLVIGGAFVLNATRQPQYGFMAAFEDKIRLLHEHDEPTLIVLGGSNVAFGIDSPTLQQHCDMQVINGGLHAALGLQFYLDVACDYAREGDVIVLVPEWMLLTGGTRPDPELRQSMVQESPSSWRYFCNLSGDELKKFVDDQAFSVLAGLVQAGSEMPTESRDLHKFEQAQLPDAYSRLKFNLQGDFVGHHQLGTTKDVAKMNGDVSCKPAKIMKSVVQINACAEALRARGVEVYLAYCPVPTPHYEKHQAAYDSIHELLVKQLDVAVLHHPAQVKYPADYFYDSVCHLNLTGKMTRTELVAQSLVAQSRQGKFHVATKPSERTSR